MSTLALSLFGKVTSTVVTTAVKRTFPQSRGAAFGHRPSDKAIELALKEASKNLGWSDKSKQRRLSEFLASPECEAIAGQVCAANILRNKKSLGEIEEEFVLCLSRHLNLGAASIQAEGSALFAMLVETIDDSLARSLGASQLELLDAKIAIRLNSLEAQLQNLPQNIALLRTTIDIDKILAFETKFRDQVSNHFRLITPPSFDSQRRIPLDEIYVLPKFERLRQTSRTPSDPSGSTIETLLQEHQRVVLLGMPGGGKSTLCAKLCHSLPKNELKLGVSERPLTPVLVVLRDFATARKHGNKSILEYLEDDSRSRYQLESPHGSFEYLLRNGRALVLFDGLDELVDTADRAAVAACVESFCNLFPSAPVVITSREVGYDQAPLADDRFECFRLSRFTREQIHDYALRWFKVEGGANDGSNKATAQAFLKETDTADDLRSNPLMLALMCNLYRGESYIPRNRPDIYEKCSTMLFDRWDRSRGIVPALSFESLIQPAMQYLAHWIYSHPQLQGGVSEDALVLQTRQYLIGRRFDEANEADEAARAFVRFCRGRAWVFADIGTSKDGQRLYQFTHRTFLEYFTAGHLVRTNPTPKPLLKVLAPRIKEAEWDVVAQLAFQIQHRRVEGAGDELIDGLIKHGRRGNAKAANVAHFLIRLLEFLVPSPQRLRELMAFVLDHATEGVFRNSEDHPFERGTDYTAKLLTGVVACATENRNQVRAILLSWLDGQIAKNGEARRTAVAIAHGLSFLSKSPESATFWNPTIEEKLATLPPEVSSALSSSELWFARYAVDRGRLDAGEMISKFGLAELFAPTRIPATTFMIFPVTALAFFNAVTENRHSTNNPRVLAGVADGFKRSILPLKIALGRSTPLLPSPVTVGIPALRKCSETELFALLMIVATWTDIFGLLPLQEHALFQQGVGRHFLSFARREPSGVQNLERIANCVLTGERLTVISDWLNNRAMVARPILDNEIDEIGPPA